MTKSFWLMVTSVALAALVELNAGGAFAADIPSGYPVEVGIPAYSCEEMGNCPTVIQEPRASHCRRGSACDELYRRNTRSTSVALVRPAPVAGCVWHYQAQASAGIVYPGNYVSATGGHDGEITGGWERSDLWVPSPVSHYPAGGWRLVCDFAGGVETFCDANGHYTRRGNEIYLCGVNGTTCRKMGLLSGD
ncbi:hypothetical protein H7X87_00115 [Acetobacteraceae bacterium]|nr:hypothetical protein [Candidatus Parcubacteria bacterium]